MTHRLSRTTRRVASAALLAVSLLGPAAHAINLRGRIEQVRSYSPSAFPVSAARIDLFDASGQRIVATAYSGADGLYYVQGIAPGRYLLRVNGRNYPCAVAPAPAGQDIPPIRIGR